MARRMVETVVSDRGNRGRWGVVATLIGYVALVGYAVFAQPEYRSPIAQAGNAVEANADRKSDNNQPPPYPVATLKAMRAAEDAGAADCGTSEECRAEQRNYSDLQAQWEAAKGAQGQLRFTRWQTWIAGLGTVLVAIALYCTARATMAAIEANKISRDSAERQLRAYVLADKPRLDEEGVDGFIEARVELRNSGQTPAYKLKSWIDIEIREKRLDLSIFFTSEKAEANRAVWDVGPGCIRTITFRREGRDFANKEDMRSKLVYIYVFGGIDYTDCFGRHQTGTFNFYFPVKPTVVAFDDAVMNHADRGNEYS